MAAIMAVGLFGFTTVARSSTKSFALNDGTAVRKLESKAGSIGGALRDNNVWVGPFDKVEPAYNEKLKDDTQVTIFRARPLVVEVEGQTQSVLSAALTVKELHKELVLSDDLKPRSKEVVLGTPIMFRKQKQIELSVSGETRSVTTTALTPEELFVDEGAPLSAVDEVTPARGTPLSDGDVVTVIRVTENTRAETQEIPFETTYRDDSNLIKGQTKVIQSGSNGLRTITYRVVQREGVVISEEVADSQIVRAPQPRIVARGTRNPSTQSGKATWYGAPAGTCAHRTLPMGTVVTVSAGGRTTTCRVADRGPFGAGRIIDLSTDVFEKLASRSAGVISVTLYW